MALSRLCAVHPVVSALVYLCWKYGHDIRRWHLIASFLFFVHDLVLFVHTKSKEVAVWFVIMEGAILMNLEESLSVCMW
jgi:hypothetical protein